MAEFPKSKAEAIGTPTEWAWNTPEHWPPGVRHVSLDDQGLGLNPRNNQLYWDGTAIVTRNTVRLEGWSFMLALIATVATAVAALWPIAVHLGWFGLKAAVA